MTHEPQQRLVSEMRGVRYGEVLAVFTSDAGFRAEVYGTQMLNDCPQEIWETLDQSVIASELGAVLVKLNGPRYWVLDGIGQKVAPIEPVLRDFNGMTMRRIATIELGDDLAAGPYIVRHVDRGAVFFFDAGALVYELVDPSGLVYVMQSYCVSVDPTLTEGDLATLGERLELPAGWAYRVRALDTELVVDTTETVATVIQDEFENTYTLPG